MQVSSSSLCFWQTQKMRLQFMSKWRFTFTPYLAKSFSNWVNIRFLLQNLYLWSIDRNVITILIFFQKLILLKWLFGHCIVFLESVQSVCSSNQSNLCLLFWTKIKLKYKSRGRALRFLNFSRQ